eukprot:TRINITY_DN74130_c0_g1_i1.p1 TRINITY_DN74130_c0_g1~~TRINITY_DN74130_c0_g1_i1.p1  ORF type:complete len:117 (-),score=5.47 TRINITY_DN74130_c0_g1_i1:214-564(-)
METPKVPELLKLLYSQSASGQLGRGRSVFRPLHVNGNPFSQALDPLECNMAIGRAAYGQKCKGEGFLSSCTQSATGPSEVDRWQPSTSRSAVGPFSLGQFSSWPCHLCLPLGPLDF